MINLLKIENFKSIKKIELQCTKLNIFIGEPDAGKSNILEALGVFSSLLYGRYTKDKKLISKDFVRYESLSNLFYNENLKQEIRIVIDGHQLKLKAYDDKISYSISLRSNFTHNDVKKLKEQNKIFKQHWAAELDFFGKVIKLPIEENKPNIPKIKMYKRLELERFTVKQFNFLIPPSGKNLLFLLNTNEELLQSLNETLADFDLRIMLRIAEEKIECIRDIRGKLIALPLKAVAETFHQLFLLWSIIKTNKDSVIVLEEPETHMFPKYSKYIAEMIAKDRNNNQYFISTHNPYFLIPMIEKAKIQDVSVFAVSYENYQTKIKKLEELDIQNILQSEDPFFNLDKYFG